jgi:hypothetical protein
MDVHVKGVKSEPGPLVPRGRLTDPTWPLCGWVLIATCICSR